MGEDFEVVDIEALERELKGKMSGNLTMPPSCSIFRVPSILVRHSPNAYTPNQFSFGPFHHRDPSLKRTEKIKSKYLLDLLSRLSTTNNKFQNSTNPDFILRGLTRAVVEVCKEARGYYAGPVDMDPPKFVEVLCLDACFIIELLRKKAYESLKRKDDPIFSMPCFLQFLWHDMILLENQVPWMVLEKLFDLSVVTSLDEKSLVQLTIELFGTMFSMTQPPIQPLVDKPHRSKHILDLLRNALIVPSRARKHKRQNWDEPMHSATTLDESGVKFKAYSDFKSVLDIKFDKRSGVLRIPALFIQETTQTVLRNLIAMEQCCPNYDALITSYAVVLDNLINTRADMEILCKSKAISTWLNMEDATRFFDKLYIDTYVNETFYFDLIAEVNEYCKRRWHRWRRVLMHDYFKHPWALISVIAAAIALVLTFLQTLFAIIKD